MPHSSMAEQAAVNREVVGSSPTGAVNGKYANWQSDSNLDRVFEGSSPSFPANVAELAGLKSVGVPLRSKQATTPARSIVLPE